MEEDSKKQKSDFIPFRLIREKYLDKLQFDHPEIMKNLANVIIENTHSECRGPELKDSYCWAEEADLFNLKIFETQLEKNLGDDAKLSQMRDEVFIRGRRE